MNSSGNAQALLRSLVVYAICVPIAIFFGYVLANPYDRGSYGYAGIFIGLLVFPILIRWHYPLLIFSWFSTVVFFFLPGAPNLWMVMVLCSLLLSISERILGKNKEVIHTPLITSSLLALAFVALITAELTGGLGFRALGSSVYGGKKYAILFLGIASYFALITRRIPVEKAKWYLVLFLLLGPLTKVVGDLYPIMPSSLYPIFAVFPPHTTGDIDRFGGGGTRFEGLGAASMNIFLLLVAVYGLRGIFLSGKPWRILLLALAFTGTLFGGYRFMLAMMLLVMILMFFIEKLYRTRLAMVFVMTTILGCAVVLPLANHLPFTFQRALAFLPVDIDPAARLSAQDSTEWRVNMWKALWPQVPDHLMLGKGYGFRSEDYDEMMSGGALSFHQFDAANTPLALSGDYHNGMLSIALTFGIWGVFVFLWFAAAGLHALWRNLKYGKPELRTINAVLFIFFLKEVLDYVSCIAGMSIGVDVPLFTGPLGLSIALNGGICREPNPQPAPVQTENKRLIRPLQPA